MADFTLARARTLVSQLEVDVSRTSICYACLCVVSFPLDAGDERRAVYEARSMTPVLWHEGLAEYALAVVRQAAEARVRDAAPALEELERRGGRSAVARALVLRLADDLARRTRTELRIEAEARERLALAPPELN